MSPDVCSNCCTSETSEPGSRLGGASEKSVLFLKRQKGCLIIWWVLHFCLQYKASAYNAGDRGSIPALGSSLEKATHSSTLAWKIPWRSVVASFIKRLFSSSSLSAINVVSSAYHLGLLIFLPAILSPACASSSPAFLMMYSA